MSKRSEARLRATRLRLLTREVARLDSKRRQVDAARRSLEVACSRDIGHQVPLRDAQLLSALDRAEGRAGG